jgi:hypothetical protein
MKQISDSTQKERERERVQVSKVDMYVSGGVGAEDTEMTLTVFNIISPDR